MSKLHEKPVLHGRDHLADHPDPIPGLPGPSGYDLTGLILATNPDAFWKLDEPSGNVAHDSSGNSHDLTAPGSPYTAPTWGEPAGPPGTTTARFVGATRVSGSLTAFTNNFTAGIWVNARGAGNSELIGQGQAAHAAAGWYIGILAPTGARFVAATGSDILYADAVRAVDTWYFVAVVRDAGTWKLYVNGILQAATGTSSPGSGYGGNTWIGNDGWGSPDGTTTAAADLSYGFITNQVLHSSDLLAMYNAGVTPGGTADSQVLLSDGAGGSHWGKVTSGAIEDGTIADADVAAAADIQPTKIQHPGGTTAFLRADGTWAAPTGGAPASDTVVWMPLTTVVSSVPELVWDASNSLIPTLTPI